MSVCLLLSKSLRPCSSSCTIFASGCRSCSTPSINGKDGLLARAWWKVPTSWSCKRVAYGAGMHWEPAHVNPMLALRTAVCSERWDEAWQDTLQEQRSQRANSRKLRATTRVESQLASLMRLLLRLCPSPSKPKPALPVPSHPGPAATLPGSCRPSAHHPWKRRPACRPKLVAKI